jgi:hypothetical protein
MDGCVEVERTERDRATVGRRRGQMPCWWACARASVQIMEESRRSAPVEADGGTRICVEQMHTERSASGAMRNSQNNTHSSDCTGPQKRLKAQRGRPCGRVATLRHRLGSAAVTFVRAIGRSVIATVPVPMALWKSTLSAST